MFENGLENMYNLHLSTEQFQEEKNQKLTQSRLHKPN